jgi:alpha-tubulin suppressor-like RCC1 family protein
MKVIEQAILTGAVGLIACSEPTMPSGTGALAVRVANISAACGALDHGNIRVQGPTPVDRLGITQTTTISNLQPGTYSIFLEGLRSGDVVCTGQQTGLNVRAGSTDTVLVPTTQFGAPSLTKSSPVTLGRQFSISYSLVTDAIGYRVFASTDSTFASANVVTTVSGTTASITVPDSGHFYLKVRAIDAFDDEGSSSGKDSTFVDPVKSVSVGWFHSCAVTESQAVYCWGENPYGGLGDSSTVLKPRPVKVRTNLRFNTVVAGRGFTCGVATNDAAYCWGENDFGQLGHGNFTDSDTAALVLGGHSFATMSAHVSFHACGEAITGGAFCWGRDTLGELGNGTPGVTNPTPTSVTGGHTFAGLSVGNFFTCGWEAGGNGFCWGDNAHGRLGLGTAIDTSVTTPSPVTGGIAFSAMSAGNIHVCGITSTGQMYCWGSGGNGALGHGDRSDVSTPQQVPNSGTGLKFTSVSAGADFTCGLTTAKEAWCWGANIHGELGDGVIDSSGTPNPTKVLGSGFEVLSAGFFHTCAVDTLGVVYCWGDNKDGALGNGTTVAQVFPTPARVVNP